MNPRRCVQTMPRCRFGRPGLAFLPVFMLASFAGMTGCGPSEEQLRLARATYAFRFQIYPDYRDGLVLLEDYRQSERHKNEFVQYGMCETTLAMLGGNYALADDVGKRAHLAVKKYQDADSETLAAWGDEAIKFFKGEPHERSLLCFYTGLACYMKGDYNNARVFFAQSVLAARTRDEDMVAFRDDFRLGHYWLGRAYLKLGQYDNARVAFGRAGVKLLYNGEEQEIQKIKSAWKKARKKELMGEALCYKKWSRGKKAVPGIADLSAKILRSEMPAALPGAAETDPTELRADTCGALLDLGFQKRVNLIIITELGRGPLKYLHGSSGAFDDYMRADRKEDAVDVYIDGHRSGPAFRLLEAYHQAVTRGVKTRRGRQTGKAVTKEVLKRVPFVAWFAGYWDISGDGRYWPSLPGAIHVYGARVSPGIHTITLKFYDINDQYLPRFDLTRHYIHVPEEGDQVLLLHSVENQENAYLLAQARTK